MRNMAILSGVMALLGSLMAFNLTTTSFQSNETYIAWQYDSPTAGVDNMMVGTIVGLALCAIIFAYLYHNSKSWIWAQMWFMFACLIIVADMMAIQVFANEIGDATLAGIGLALFLASFAIFLIVVVRLIWSLYKNYIDEFMAVWNGRKTGKSK